MQTTSIHVSTLCVPCENRCRYCLLSWNGKLFGADYDRCECYARGFYHWLKENRPEISFQFYYGYAMEHPDLPRAIDFARSIGSAGGEFLQLDGLRFRQAAEAKDYLGTVYQHGIRAVDLTFYGTQEYHDCFAGRKGDFSYMLLLLEQANAVGLEVNVSIPITGENAGQMEELLDLFDAYAVQNLRIFVPHREGRGVHLENIRLTMSELMQLSPRVCSHINTKRYKSESQWVTKKRFWVPQQRMLGLQLTPENIGYFESISYGDTIAYLEKLDEDFYAAIPALEDLAERYGDPKGEKLFDQRDLYLYYQSKYIQETNMEIYDINDERQCFSRRF